MTITHVHDDTGFPKHTITASDDVGISSESKAVFKLTATGATKEEAVMNIKEAHANMIGAMKELTQRMKDEFSPVPPSR